MSAVTVTVERGGDHLVVRWSHSRASGTCRFERAEGSVPEWLAPADELFGDADRRTAGRIVDALSSWADEAGLSLGIWEDGGLVEVLA